MRHAIWPMGVVALALATPTLEAQEPTPRRQEPIEIRGTVPTPQVVTVRPRETPAYSRKVLVPNFFDHDFWPAILPAYMLVAERMVSGQAPVDASLLADTLSGAARRMMTDTLGTRRDSLGRLVPPAARIDPMPARPDSARTVPPPRSDVPPPAPPAGDDRTLSHARPSPHGAGTASASSSLRQQSLTWIKRRL
jgi:hypothetical protein